MNKLTEQILKYKKANISKLKDYGFHAAGGAYVYSADVLDGQFRLTVKIDGGDVETEVRDKSTDEPYMLYLIEDASGSFVGAVRTACKEVLTDVARCCFDDSIFKNEQTQRVIDYVTETYGDKLEFLWKKFPDNAIWRRSDNAKWYGAILTVEKRKLGQTCDGKAEILDLRYDADKITEIVDGKKILGGYHMNKKHWITVILDGSVALPEICALIDNSYRLAANS